LLEALAFHFFPAQILTASALEDFLWHRHNGYVATLDADHPLRMWLRGPVARADVSGEGWIRAVRRCQCWEYLFLHLTFQEYLCAAHLGRLVGSRSWEQVDVLPANAKAALAVLELLEQVSERPRWHEVVIMLAGTLRHPAPLFRLLLDGEGRLPASPTGAGCPCPRRARYTCSLAAETSRG